MKVLVEGRTLGPEHRRLAMAAAGLSLRGHEVRWLSPPSWPEPERPHLPIPVRSGWDLPRFQMDLAIGGDVSPGRVALSGWLTRARGLVLGLAGERARRWGILERAGWESMGAVALAPLEVVESLRERPTHLDPERLTAWPDGPEPEWPDATHPDVEALERTCERLIARRRTGAPRPGAFLDRDGTLIVEKHYVSHAADVELLPGVPEALRMLAAAGYALVVISNQSGVARGYFPLAAVYETTGRLRRELRVHGVEIEAFHFCPHHPDEVCRCRKPGTELLERAARDLRLTLRESVMIGDKMIDVATGHRVKALGVLVRSGHGGHEERQAPENGRAPDRVCDDLLAAAGWLAARLVERPD